MTPLVIFDCDGVLVDSERLVNATEAAYFTRLGAPMDTQNARELFKGKTVAQVAADVESIAGRPLPPDWAYEWAMAVAVGLAKELRATAGIRDVLGALRASGRAFCLASQSSLPRIALSLHITQLEEFFAGAVFSASMVERPKPAPDLFLFAAENMGAAPRDCTVVEDSPSGVLAARAAGMRVLGYAADEDPARLADAGAEVFHHMNELPALLEIVAAANH